LSIVESVIVAKFIPYRG